MRLTNKFSLPTAIFNAIKNDDYTKGEADFSVTELLKPAYQRALQLKHYDDIEEDAMDRVWSLVGRSIHKILELADTETVTERRLTMEIAGTTISGGMDSYRIKDKKLIDYKVTTAWKFKKNEPPKEFIEQLNIYAEILRRNNIQVDSLEIVAILRDYSKLEAIRTNDYPKQQVITVSVPMWDEMRVKAFILDRILKHTGPAEPCSADEKWAKPTQYAVMKDTQKRAVRVFDSKEIAYATAATLGIGHSVAIRPGKSVRCESYCSVAKWCPSYQKEIEDAIQANGENN